MRTNNFLIIFSSLMVLFVASQVQAETKYTIIDLESQYIELQNSTYTSAYGINNHGQVALYFYNPGDSQGFLWDPTWGLENLGTLGGDTVQPLDINDNGKVVGRAKASNGQFFPFIWDKINGMQNIGTLDNPLNDSIANAINDKDQVAGCSSTRVGPCYPFIWDSINGMDDLGTYSSPYSPGQARGINNKGEVAGTLEHSIYYFMFMWDEVNGIQEIGSFDKNSAIPNDINDNGVVVGNNCTAPYLCSAFMWTQSSGKTDLGSLGNSTLSWAEAINEAGQVVGNSPYINDYRAQRYAFIWQKKNGMRDLNDLIPSDSGWILENATDINELGQITGWGLHNDKTKAFVLIPYKIIEARIWFNPRMLNKKSKGKWITSFIDLPEESGLSEVPPETTSIVKINGVGIDPPLPAVKVKEVKHHRRSISFNANFDRQEVIALLREGTNIITISGTYSTGDYFQGTSKLYLWQPAITNHFSGRRERSRR